MRRLNPLYLIVLCLTITFISFYVLNNKKVELEDKKSEYLSFSQKSQDYKTLKSQWSNKNFANETIDRIVKNRAFANEKILVANTGKVIKVRIESKNTKLLDNFLNKILNKPLVIKKLDIKNESITFEIGVK